MQPKFLPGQKVTADNRECEVVSMAFVPPEGEKAGFWRYTVSSMEWDPKTRQLIKGVEHHAEDELEAINE